MMRMLYESHINLGKDYAKEFKSLSVINALDGSEDYLVSKRVYQLMGTGMIDFRNQLMKTAAPKNLKKLLKMITPSKRVKQKDTEGSAAPINEGDELFDCKGEEIETETIRRARRDPTSYFTSLSKRRKRYYRRFEALQKCRVHSKIGSIGRAQKTKQSS